jgi:hypothetical protein
MSNAQDASHHRVQAFLPGCMAFFMSALVSAVVTMVNTGVDSGLASRWLTAWALALPVATIAAYATRPLALFTARRLASLFDRLAP